MTEEDIIAAGPEGFRGDRLDSLLSTGYFRAGTRMYFATRILRDLDFEKFEYVYNGVFKLRVNIRDMQPLAEHHRIRKIRHRFEVRVLPATIHAESEALYAAYHAHIAFDTASTCSEYLFQGESGDPFDGRMIEIREEGSLIAVGYFDKGRDALMGVLNVYHPERRKFSLGKYLILLKTDLAREWGMTYFYPGSIYIGDDKTDYKYFLGKENMEVYLPVEKSWQPLAEWPKDRLESYSLELFKDNGGLRGFFSGVGEPD